jgi:hypothetical protein
VELSDLIWLGRVYEFKDQLFSLWGEKNLAVVLSY